MEFSSITFFLLSSLAFSAIQARILPNNLQVLEDNDQCLHGIFKISSSFLFSEELMEKLCKEFKLSFNKDENIGSVGRGGRPVPPSPKPDPGTRWKLPSEFEMGGVGREARPAPPPPRAPSGPHWKLPPFSGRSIALES